MKLPLFLQSMKTTIKTPKPPIRKRVPKSEVAGTFTRGRSFEVTVAGTSPSVRWTRDGRPLTDGPQPGGEVVSGSQTDKLVLTNLPAAAAGRYGANVFAALDFYDADAHRLRLGAVPVTVQSSSAELLVEPR